MPFPSAKRVAALAVGRYGADRAQVHRLAATVPRGDEEAAELLAALVHQGLLTARQAGELRRLLEPLAIDTGEPPTMVDVRTHVPEITESDLELPPETAPVLDELRELGGFRILRRLGEGSMGVVYLGYHEKQERQVAIKVLADWLATNPNCVERFYRESKNSTLLAHPNIVRGFTAGYDGAKGKHYLVREFVDGLSGQVLLDRLGQLPVGAAVQIVLDVARALEYLHGRKLVHRDIKPDNVLLTRSGVAKLADLGLLKRIDEPGPRTAVHTGFGTSYYMPYEQAVGNRLDGRSDIYALGATFYHLLTGEVPFAGNTHQEVVDKKERGNFVPASAINPLVAPELDRILRGMLARHPQERYPNATALVADLERSGLAAGVTAFAEVTTALNGDGRSADPEHPDQRTRPDFELLRGGASHLALTRPGSLSRRVAQLCRIAWPLTLVALGVASALLLVGAAVTTLVLALNLPLD